MPAATFPRQDVARSLRWFFGEGGEGSGGRSLAVRALLSRVQDALSNSCHELPIVNERDYIAALEVWHETAIARLQHASALETLRQELTSSTEQPWGVVDLGCGDGRLVYSLCQLGANLQQQLDAIALVDIKKACITEAEERLSGACCGANISKYLCGIEQISPAEIVGRWSNRVRVVALFSSCLHELPVACRMRVISNWHRAGALVCISEIEGGYERFRWGTRLFGGALSTFYASMVSEVEVTKHVCRGDRDHAIEALLLPEILRVLLEPAAKRRDRHFWLNDLLDDLARLRTRVRHCMVKESPTGLRAFSVVL
jgi:SAM-dependent methyltransferase